MIKSMTGFGAAKGVSGKLGIAIEVKSVNNRHLDCNVKIPRVFSSIEEMLKSKISASISRGKVDVTVYIDSSNADDMEIKVNHSLAKSYIEALREIAQANGLSGDVKVSDLTRFPDILQATKREIDTAQFSDDISAILDDALRSFDEMRCGEGARLCADITARLDEIDRLTGLAEEISPQTVAQYRTKLEARLNEMLQSTTIDESRILTEAAIFADRTAINEELVRLRSHTSQLRQLLGSANEAANAAVKPDSIAVGRKIDFLIQELNREANTIGSKGNDARMAKIVVDMKAEIEKIREQAQNVE